MRTKRSAGTLPVAAAVALLATTSSADEREPREREAGRATVSDGSSYGPVREPGETEWNSKALAITGGAVAGAGVFGIVLGAALYAGDDCDETEHCLVDVGKVFGTADMVVGGLALATGAGLFIAGAYQIPTKDPKSPPTTAAFSVQPARADLVVTF